MEGLKYLKKECVISGVNSFRKLPPCWRSRHFPDAGATGNQDYVMSFRRPIASAFSLSVLGALYWQHIPKLHWQGSQRSAISRGYSQSITEGRHYAKIIEILNWWHKLIYYGENRSNQQEPVPAPTKDASDYAHHIHIFAFLSFIMHSYQFSSVAQSCPNLCDPMRCSIPGFPVHHQIPEFTQTHVHWVAGAIQPSQPLSFPSPPFLNLSQHQDHFQWVSSSHQVAKVLEFQLWNQFF